VALERLAQWWTQAAQTERWECYRRSIHKDPQAPPLETLQLAIYLAEVEQSGIST
jgi:hypothetical protein